MTDAAIGLAQAQANAGTGPAFLPPFAASAMGSMGIELELMVLDRLSYDLMPKPRPTSCACSTCRPRPGSPPRK
ncbi:hypothetical protein LP419_38260 [Massilia sp. H-1]|nr:hypothetical protein LP419_38260 [Massilia sp. H-1]